MNIACIFWLYSLTTHCPAWGSIRYLFFHWMRKNWKFSHTKYKKPFKYANEMEAIRVVCMSVINMPKLFWKFLKCFWFSHCLLSIASNRFTFIHNNNIKNCIISFFFAGAVVILHSCSCEKRLIEYTVSVYIFWLVYHFIIILVAVFLFFIQTNISLSFSHPLCDLCLHECQIVDIAIFHMHSFWNRSYTSYCI